MNFKTEDIIEFCDEHYIVVENSGDRGVVKEYNPDGSIGDAEINFYWNFQGEQCKLVKRDNQLFDSNGIEIKENCKLVDNLGFEYVVKIENDVYFIESQREQGKRYELYPERINFNKFMCI